MKYSSPDDVTLQGLLGTAVARNGHFRYESGHHGNVWLELELLCLRPRQIEESILALSARLQALAVDAVCGPLNEGAFVALMVALKLGVEFCYAERFEPAGSDKLFPVEYRIPGALRDSVRGKRVAIVNDVISAGSAVRGAYADLIACGGEPVALAALVVLGESAERFAQESRLPLIYAARFESRLWTPSECPLCAAGMSLQAP